MEATIGKRSDFVRRPMDFYETPYEATLPLVPFLRGIKYFSEPCAGNRKLIGHLERHGLTCIHANDISWPDGHDALRWATDVHTVITNPPWTRQILHPLIRHFQQFAPTWLLFDADWAHTHQAAPYLDQCSHIVSIGRVKWIEGSKNTGKDNACWYRFHSKHSGGPHFYGRQEIAA